MKTLLEDSKSAFKGSARQLESLRKQYSNDKAHVSLLELSPDEISKAFQPAALGENMLVSTDERNYEVAMEFALPILQQLHKATTDLSIENNNYRQLSRDLWDSRDKTMKENRKLTSDLQGLAAEKERLSAQVSRLQKHLPRSYTTEPQSSSRHNYTSTKPSSSASARTNAANVNQRSIATQPPASETEVQEVYELDGTPILTTAEIGGSEIWPFKSKWTMKWERLERRKSL